MLAIHWQSSDALVGQPNSQQTKKHQLNDGVTHTHTKPHTLPLANTNTAFLAFLSYSFLICVFFCLDRMTKFDVKNYLEKIYNVPVGAVRTRIQFGEYLHCFA